MRVPLTWLAEYVHGLPDPAELADRLTMAGLEVEAIHRPSPELTSHLTVARIEEIVGHPNADRLSLCTVDDGTSTRQVVCGATNMSAGDRVVLAEPGAHLPNGLKIKKSKIRGQESNGMLCSAAELGLEAASDGILVLSENAAVGRSAAEYLGLDESVIEIAVTPNRGDCLSIRGVAREVAAVCRLATTERLLEAEPTVVGRARHRIEIESPEKCSAYYGLALSGAKVAESPAWLRARLTAAGLRPINNVVDVTNYVLLDRGQPLHAFDAGLLAGTTITVGTIVGDTDFVTLDGATRRLVAGDLVILDAGGPVAIAGVMGGQRTAVHAGTRELFLESAVFAPATVRSTARRLGLPSESSHRFERGVDATATEQALLAAARMMAQLTGAQTTDGVVRAGRNPEPARPIQLRVPRIALLLGSEVSAEEADSAMQRLGASTSRDQDGSIIVTPPSWRNDLTREVDLIEEIARMRGYETFPEQTPSLAMSRALVPAHITVLGRARERLCTLGLTEVIGLAFASSERNEQFPGLLPAGGGAVRLSNPLRMDAGEMRRSLLPALIEAHLHNVRAGAAVTDLFTIGRVFGRGAGEVQAVGGLLWGPRRGRKVGADGAPQFWDAKAFVEQIVALVGGAPRLVWRPAADRNEYHPGACGVARLADRIVGYAGRVHPEIASRLNLASELCLFEVDSTVLVSYAPPPRAVRPLARYPGSGRDVSLLVPVDLLAGDVIATVEGLSEPLIESISVFDEYRGQGVPEGHRALAFSLVYRSADRTLTEDEVSRLHDRVVRTLVDRLSVQVRG